MVRVSRRGQLAGQGCSRQVVAVDEYARAHDIEVVRTFKAEGISGARNPRKDRT